MTDIEHERLRALAIVSSQVRADLERQLSDLGEDIEDDDNERLHDALASITTVEALFDWLLGDYVPSPGTLIHSLMLREKRTVGCAPSPTEK